VIARDRKGKTYHGDTEKSKRRIAADEMQQLAISNWPKSTAEDVAGRFRHKNLELIPNKASED